MEAITRPSDDGVTMIDGTSVRVHHLAATLRVTITIAALAEVVVYLPPKSMP
ncbi:hypothetical protein SAMN05421750_11389 [Agrobacterium pusense]|nr:hypothetical protein SAMN05421750_11389 [Agrobacterium pusense]